MQDLIKSHNDKVQLTHSSPVIVLGGGDFSADQLTEFVAKGYPLIAADGAADAALSLGLKLRAVVGDFDSIKDRDAFASDVELIEIDEQETTDFEKCLYSVEAPLFVCFGMLGKRVDHTLAAFHTIARYGGHKKIVLMDQVDLTVGVSGDFAIDLPKATRFSIYPLRPIAFESSKGLKYPLDGLQLGVGERIGTSNETDQPSVFLKVGKKTHEPYLVILPRTHFGAIVNLMERKQH